ncbi:MAG: hypothetical protein R3B81_17940 [bacterium]
MRTALLVLLAIALGIPARAATLDLPVETVHWIAREDGDARLLLRVDDLSAIRGRLVKSATLVLPVGQAVGERDLNLYVYAAGRSWSAAADWYSPWVRPGGDWNLDNYDIVRLPAGESRDVLRFDVAPILREIAEGREANYGFVLMPSGGETGGRFLSSERGTIGALTNAVLGVTTIPMPRRGRG